MEVLQDQLIQSVLQDAETVLGHNDLDIWISFGDGMYYSHIQYLNYWQSKVMIRPNENNCKQYVDMFH